MQCPNCNGYLNPKIVKTYRGEYDTEYYCRVCGYKSTPSYHIQVRDTIEYNKKEDKE